MWSVTHLSCASALYINKSAPMWSAARLSCASALYIIKVPPCGLWRPVPKDAERHWDVNLILFIGLWHICFMSCQRTVYIYKTSGQHYWNVMQCFSMGYFTLKSWGFVCVRVETNWILTKAPLANSICVNVCFVLSSNLWGQKRGASAN